MGEGNLPAADIRVQMVDTEVVARVFDGEAIIINVANGRYYSLGHVGTLAWLLLTGGYSLKDAAAFMAGRYGMDDTAVASDVEKLVGQLMEEGLVAMVDDSPGRPSGIELAPVTGATYETPTLTVYSDMTDVLALDPPLPEIVEDDP